MVSQAQASSLGNTTATVDLLIKNGRVDTGEDTKEQLFDWAICGEIICGIYLTGRYRVAATQVVDVNEKIISPGLIDPHTHNLAKLLSKNKNHNLNYLTQGVITVVNGNDGGVPVDIPAMVNKLNTNYDSTLGGDFFRW